MSAVEAQQDQVPLSDLLRAAGLIALTVTGAIIFLPSLFFLVGRGDASVADWLAWLIPVGVWLLGFAPAVRPVRAWIQTAAGVLFLLMAAVVPGAPWIPVSTIAFAIVVAGIFTLPWRAALNLIAITATMDVALALVPSARLAIYDGGPMPVLTGALLQILAGGGLLIAWHSWVRTLARADGEHAEIRATLVERERLRARSNSSAAVARRIHETVLNTLAAISMGIPQPSQAAARAACRRDLEQMELGLRQLPDCTIAEILHAAIGVATLDRVDVDFDGDRQVIIPAVSANVIRDAVVEALRNVERHSGERTALIRAQVNGVVHIDISDQGIGISQGALERFGLRNAIRSGLESIGGQVEVRVGNTGGTVVCLTAPRGVRAGLDMPRLELLGVLDSDPAARIGVLGTNLFMVIFAVPVAAAMPRSGLLLTGMLLYVGIVVAIAVVWASRLRVPLTVLAVMILVATLALAALSSPGCGSDWAVVMILTGMSGGATLLPLISIRGWVPRFTFVIAVGICTFAIAFALPEECRSLPLLVAFATIAYLNAFAVGLTWADEVFERRRERAQAQWRALVTAEATGESLRAVQSGWGEVGPGARDLLEGLADGSLGFDDAGVRARAAAEGATIRESLGFADVPGDAVSHLTRRLIRAAAHAGATVDVEILTPFTRGDRYPDEVLEYLENLVRQVPDQNLAIRGFADEGYEELVMIVPNAAIRDPATRFIHDCAIQVSVGGENSHVIIRRRDAQA